MKTLSFCPNSSARASFRASLTAISFAPLGVAYLLLLTVVGNDAINLRRLDLLRGIMGRGAERQRKAGRRRLEATITSVTEAELKTREK